MRPKAPKSAACRQSEAVTMFDPTLRCAAVRLLLAMRQAPLPIRISHTLSRPTNVVATRPGWTGDR